MDAEYVLEALLKILNLGETTNRLIREVLKVILSVIKSLWGSISRRGRTPSTTVIEDTAEKLREVIAFFNSADQDRQEFLSVFPKWKGERTSNVKKLNEIAESLKENRQFCSVAQIVGGSVGVVGGVAIIGSILFPPAAPALLPAWLGGAAATALIPSFLLPTVAATTSGVAIGGAVAAGAGGVTQLATSVTELVLTSKHIDEAKDICQRDKDNFVPMMKWFQRSHQLESALDDLLAANILDVIFKDMKDFFGVFSVEKSSLTALKQCIQKLFGRCFHMDPHLEMALTAILFVVFLAKRRNRFLFQCIILTHKFGFGLMGALNATDQFGRLIASAVVKEVDLIPRAVASKVAVGAMAGLGIVLDVTNIVLNSIDLVEGSKSEVQEKVLKVAEELKKELDTIEEVYRELNPNNYIGWH